MQYRVTRRYADGIETEFDCGTVADVAILVLEYLQQLREQPAYVTITIRTMVP